jgi:hypothetical protein
MEQKVYAEAGAVDAQDGKVHQEGPDGVCVDYEPGAAMETGHRLIDAGLAAEREKERSPSSE